MNTQNNQEMLCVVDIQRLGNLLYNNIYNCISQFIDVAYLSPDKHASVVNLLSEFFGTNPFEVRGELELYIYNSIIKDISDNFINNETLQHIEDNEDNIFGLSEHILREASHFLMILIDFMIDKDDQFNAFYLLIATLILEIKTQLKEYLLLNPADAIFMTTTSFDIIVFHLAKYNQVFISENTFSIERLI